MYNFILEIFFTIGLTNYAQTLAYAATLIAVVIICILARLVFKFIIVKIAAKISNHTKNIWDDILLNNKTFHKLSNLAVLIVMHIFKDVLPSSNNVLEKVVNITSVIVILTIINALVNSAGEIYNRYEVSKVRPINSLLQVIKIGVYIIGSILCVATLAGQSPFVLLGGIGAMTAITSLIFKDAILGFVAGIQLTANDMIRIGDWIEMPNGSANGEVIDLLMTTVKVKNFDNTITSLPAYTLLSDAFINWRGMQTAGGRRIKRAIYIDATYVSICNNEMIERFKGIKLLENYINEKEIELSNSRKSTDKLELINCKQITNIGTFRIYAQEYLKQHPYIRKDMSIMVRQLQPGSNGLPLEIYAFSNTVIWTEYEGIQSDIFDHLYSVIPVFGLKIYQNPSSGDVRSIIKESKI